MTPSRWRPSPKGFLKIYSAPGRAGYERSLADIVGAAQALPWQERGLGCGVLPIAGGAGSPREDIERLIADGKIPRGAVDAAERLWRERWRRGVTMPNGETATISLDALYHVLTDDRIWRNPRRVENLLRTITEIRTGPRLGRRRAFSEWQEEDQALNGYAILDQDGALRTLHLVRPSEWRRLQRQGERLWPS